MTCIRAHNHPEFVFGHRVPDEDKDRYRTLDSTRGQCGVCDDNYGFGDFICAGCHQAIKLAKDTEV